MQCRLTNVVTVGADGQPALFDVAFTPARLLQWVRAARSVMMNGQPGVAVGACSRCAAPLVLSSRAPLELPCPHCREPVRGTAAQLLVDQWPEPWTRVEGGGISLEYRVASIDDTTEPTAGCAGCGAPTPREDPSNRCRRCGACIWVERETDFDGDGVVEKRRMQLGLRIDGTRQDRPADALLSLAQGEAMLRSDNAHGSSASSSSWIGSYFAIGCAGLVGITILIIVAVKACGH